MLCLSEILLICNNTGLCLTFRTWTRRQSCSCVYRSTWQTRWVMKCFWNIQASTRSECVCVCLCVHSKAASLGALHQNARLCFCSCVALQLLFLPRITLQVLSRFLLYVPLLLSALVSRPRLSRLSSPSNSLDSCQQACDWQSHSAGRASQPLINPSPRLPVWWLPWQRSDWVGCSASCVLSQRVIWGCVLLVWPWVHAGVCVTVKLISILSFLSHTVSPVLNTPTLSWIQFLLPLS